MRRFLAIFFLLFVLLLNQTSVVAQSDEAICDLCGLCRVKENDLPERVAAPSNWESCRACIYPQASTDPDAKETLKITLDSSGTPSEPRPPTPAPGKFYLSALGPAGCIDANLPNFQQPGAAAGLVGKLIQVISTLAGGIAFLYILWGAYIVATSRDEPERLNYGKRLVIGAILGLIVALSAVFLVNLIATYFLKLPGFGT